MEEKATSLVRTFAKKGLTLATAESCTGGWIAKAVTDVSGCSAVLLGGVVAYTNEVKRLVLGVEAAVIEQCSEVSNACAEAMAQGVRMLLKADVGVSTTGFAGPGGGNDRDPVGTVYIGISTKTRTWSERFSAPPSANRNEVRFAALCRVLDLLQTLADTGSI